MKENLVRTLYLNPIFGMFTIHHMYGWYEWCVRTSEISDVVEFQILALC